MNNNKKKLFIVGGISLALIAVIGITYAWLTQVLNGTKVNKITAGTLDLILDDEASDGIDLQYAVPQSDSQGLNNQAYTFKVINNGSINAKYSIYLEDEELENGLSRMSDSNIKFDLVKNSGESNPRLLSTVVSNNKRVLDNNVVINGGSTNEYTLRLWIDQEATTEEVSGKAFAAKIKIEAIQEETSNGNTKQYVYATLGDGPNGNGVITHPSEGRTERPNDKNAYLKYELTDGKIEMKTVTTTDYNNYNEETGEYGTKEILVAKKVEACTYSDTYGEELCLKENEYETSLTKIKTYFGFDENTWTDVSTDYQYMWKNADQSITCLKNKDNSTNFSCSTSKLGVGAFISDKQVMSSGYNPTVYCSIYNGESRCSIH